MNANQLYVLESLIGPPSEKVDIQTFLGSTATFSQTYSQTNNFTQEIKDECSVSDIRDSLRDTWDDPSLSSYLTKYHDRTIQALDNAMNQKTSKANRKACVPESDATQAEFELQATLDSVSLKSFRLKADAAPFMRTARNSDKNILQSVKSTPASNSSDETEEAIITMSIYNKLTWTPSYVARSSQHVFLSSHTLQDVADILPCTSKNLPPEAGLSEESSDSFVVCLEGTVYGSRSGEEGYAAKIFELATAKEGSSLSLSSSPLRDVPLRLLSLRINEPYWLVHAGNCEHFLVVDQIRLRHQADPTTGYPLTLQITPPLPDLCRACGKVSATLSILDDIRLGETPCLMCGPCWKSMGESEEATVLPLVGFSVL